MRLFFGIALMIIGIILGLYVGGWVCFIGGIVDVITEVRAENLVPLNVGIGVGKVFFAAFFGWLSCIVLLLPGYLMAKDA